MEDIQCNSIKGKILKAVLCSFIPLACALLIYLVAVLSFNQEIPASVIRLLATASLLVPNILTAEGGFSMLQVGGKSRLLTKNKSMLLL